MFRFVVQPERRTLQLRFMTGVTARVNAALLLISENDHRNREAGQNLISRRGTLRWFQHVYSPPDLGGQGTLA